MTERTILFDAHWLADGPPSGKNVVRSLIEGWSTRFPFDDLTAAVAPGFKGELGPGVTHMEVSSFVPSHGGWLLSSLGARARSYDGVVTQNFAPIRLAPRGTRIATFVHDAMYVDHPEWFSFLERIYLRASLASLRSADVVVTSSSSEAARIHRAMKRIDKPIHAIGLGVPTALMCARSTMPVDPPRTESFILAVGRLNVRKNLQRLIEAFERHPTDLELLVVGAADGVTGITGYSGLDRRIRFLGALPDGQLKWLYENCAYFVFPSLDEGFGLPLLEAHAFGAPAIVSDIPSFRELGLASGYFDPSDTASIVAAMEMIEFSKPNRRSKGGSLQETYSWTNTVGLLRQALFPEDMI